MSKLGTDKYLAKFDCYGDGKTKAKKGKKEEKKGKDKKKKKGKSTKLCNKLMARVILVETKASAASQVSDDAINLVTEIRRETNTLLGRVEALEKNQKTLASQVKSLGKAQKAMEKDIAAAESPAE